MWVITMWVPPGHGARPSLAHSCANNLAHINNYFNLDPIFNDSFHSKTKF